MRGVPALLLSFVAGVWCVYLCVVMMEEGNIWVMIVSNVVTLLSGGGLGWVFTIKSLKRQQEADAMKSAQEVYRGVIEDLNQERGRLQGTIERMEAENRERSAKLAGVERQLTVIKRQLSWMKPLLCGVKDCERRKPINLKKGDEIV